VNLLLPATSEDTQEAKNNCINVPGVQPKPKVKAENKEPETV
jgi:hypothetical protein